MQEIREWFDGPLALSGAIATGGAILAAQAMGADLAYIGSAFIATAGSARDRRLQAGDRRRPRRGHRRLEPVHRRVRQLPAPSIVRAGLDPDNLPAGDVKTMNFAAATAGAGVKAWRDIWGSGQGIGAVKAVTPAAELIDRLAKEYSAAKARLCAG